MTDNKWVKESLIFGLSGAIILPLIHECYANIGKTFSMIVLFLLVVFVSFRFSKYKPKEATTGIATTIALSGILGICIYLIFHGLIVDFLSKISKYFYLSTQEQIWYYIYVFILLILIFAFYFIFHGIKVAIKKTKDNGKKAQEYIDNAFDEKFDNKED